MSQVTLQLLARELGLSMGTVSKALRDSHEISAETKKLVLDLAKKYNYSPNPYASSLRRKRSNTIAVVIPEVADSFFSLAIRGIEEIAQRKGFHVLIYLTYERFENEQKILEDCRNGRVDGVLMSLSSETSSFGHIEQLTAENIPVVFFDRAPDHTKISKVVTDDFESAYHATNHLANCRCKKIVYLSISHSLDMNTQRMNGFKKALQEQGLYHESEPPVIDCTNDADANLQVIREVLTGPNPPDGMLVSVEKLMIPVYRLCKELSLDIPAKLKLICFSTSAYAPILTPALTTVEQPANEIGKEAATLLFKALLKKQVDLLSTIITVPSILQIRESAIGR